MQKKYFKDIFEIKPEYRKTLLHLSSLALRENNQYSASKFLMKAIEAKPKDIVAYHNLGIIFRKNKKFQKAEWLFKKALSINQIQPATIRLLALTYKDLNKIDDANELIEKALKLIPQSDVLLKTKSQLEKS